MNVPSIAERNIAARDSEGSAGEEDLPTLAERDAALEAGLRGGAKQPDRDFGRQPAVVVVDDDVVGGGEREIELQALEVRPLQRTSR